MSDNYIVLNNYHVIEKSKSLIQLDQYAELGEAQYILLDMYMSQINPRDKGTKEVSFPKTDYEVYKEVKRVKPAALDKELQALMIPVKLPDPSDEKSFRIKPLFKECSCLKKEDGNYWITMICEEEMYDYFFDISKIGYIRYRLGMMRNLNLSARLLYNELHSHKYIKPYMIPLDRLKIIMKLTSKSYEDTKEVMRIVRKSVNDINENTNLLVSFKKQNDGNHKLVAINFTVNINAEKVDEDLALYIAELIDVNYDDAVPVAKAAQSNNLSDTEIKERIEHIKSKTNVKNIVGYSVRIMDNEFWEKIKGVEKEEDPLENDKEKNKDLLSEIEDLYMSEVEES